MEIGYIFLFTILVLIAGGIAAWINFRILIPANEAAIIYGRKSKFRNPETGAIQVVGSRVISKGNGAFRMPFLEDVMWISLETMDINLEVRDIMSKKGVEVDVVAVAVVKVADDEHSIRKAATQFGDLKKKENNDKLNRILEETLQGFFRSVIATLSPEDLYFDRMKFHQKVQELAGDPLNTMGIEIVNFSIKSIVDNTGYLEQIKKKDLAKMEKEQESESMKLKREQEESINKDKLKLETIREELGIKREEVEGALKKAEIERLQIEEAAEVAKTKFIEKARVERDQYLAEIRSELRDREIDLEKKTKELRDIENQTLLLDAKLEADRKLLIGEATAEVDKIKLLKEAEGKEKLAGVYNSVDPVTRALLVIDQMPNLLEKVLGKDGLTSIFEKISEPMGKINNLNIHDYSGGQTGEGVGPLRKLLETSPLIVEQVLRKAKDLGLNERLKEVISIDEKPKQQKKLKPKDNAKLIDELKTINLKMEGNSKPESKKKKKKKKENKSSSKK